MSFSYDHAGQRVWVSDNFGGTESLGYDGAGDLTTLVYADSGDSLSINFLYNQDGHEISEIIYSSGTLIASVNDYYIFDDFESIVASNSAGATLDYFSYSYNYAGELTSESDYLGSGSTTTTSYSYDPTGQLIDAGAQTYSYNLAGDPARPATRSTPATNLPSSSIRPPATRSAIPMTTPAT